MIHAAPRSLCWWQSFIPQSFLDRARKLSTRRPEIPVGDRHLPNILEPEWRIYKYGNSLSDQIEETITNISVSRFRFQKKETIACLLIVSILEQSEWKDYVPFDNVVLAQSGEQTAILLMMSLLNMNWRDVKYLLVIPVWAQWREIQ